MANEEQRVWYVRVNAESEAHGPYTWDEIQLWLAEGRLRQDSLCRREGMGDWMPLSGALALSKHTAAPELAAGSGGRGLDIRKAIVGVVVVVSALVCAFAGFKAIQGGHGAKAVGFVKDKVNQLSSDKEQPTGPDPSGTIRGQTETLMQEAKQAVEGGDLAEGRRLWTDVEVRSREDPSLRDCHAAAEQWLHWIDLTEHPESRFVIKGVTVGVKTIVQITDRRDGVDHRVKPGEPFGDFVLESYDEDGKTAKISQNAKVFTIRHS